MKEQNCTPRVYALTDKLSLLFTHYDENRQSYGAVSDVIVKKGSVVGSALSSSMVQMSPEPGRSFIITIADINLSEGDELYLACRQQGSQDNHIMFNGPLLNGDNNKEQKILFSAEECVELLDRLGSDKNRLLFLQFFAETVFMNRKKDSNQDLLTIFREWIDSVQSKITLKIDRLYQLDSTLHLLHVPGIASSLSLKSHSWLTSAAYYQGSLNPVLAYDTLSAAFEPDKSNSQKTQMLLLWFEQQLVVVDATEAQIAPGRILQQDIAKGIRNGTPVSPLLETMIASTGSRGREVKSLLEYFSSLRSVQPATALTLSPRLQIGISKALRTTDGQMCVFGWHKDLDHMVEDIQWIGNNGQKISIWNKRYDVDHYALPERLKSANSGQETETENAKVQPTHSHDQASGFMTVIDTSPSNPFSRQEKFVVTLKNGASKEVLSPPALESPRAKRDMMLALPDVKVTDRHRFMAYASPFIDALQKDTLNVRRLKEVIYIGQITRAPTVSVIIPLYRNISFLKAQYTAFALNPSETPVELVYVLDDPDLIEQVSMSLRALEQIYNLPVTVVCHKANLGYAPACNTGLRHARGEFILLLNSDCIPEEAGAIDSAAARLRENETIAAVGGKLLFADGTLQHAGLDFFKDTNGHVYNRSLYKGYPASYEKAQDPREVKAVTGAALMVKKTSLQKIGGLCEDYVIGDFEDTDLCFRLKEDGSEVWYDPASVFVHFERQSIELHELHVVSCAEIYNQYIHQQRWFS